ncbi:MAG: hydrolase TatD [Chloroflexota bacterium]
MQSLADTHLHLFDPQFREDLGAVLARARQAGVNVFVSAALDLDTARENLEIAATEPGVFAAVGFHPGSAGRLDAGALAALADLAGRPKVVAIGEVGLDFYRMYFPPEVQEQAFIAQLELAVEVDLPVVVHTREAWPRMLELLRAQRRRLGPRLRGVFHAFSGDLAAAEEAGTLGFYFGVGGAITYPKNDRLREVVARLPRDRVVVETDAPYLPPQPWRGRRNEPAYLVEVVRVLAGLWSAPVEAVIAQTTANACQLFALKWVAVGSGLPGDALN